MSSTPLALTDRDLDAYLPEKAASNAFTRPRLEVKQRALSWARNVTSRLAEQGFGVEVHATDEHPSHRNKRRVDAQWVFFWRDEAARDEIDRLLERGRSIADVLDDPSPFARHAFLALRIDSAAVEVCFAVHPDAQVDIDNLRARLAAGSEHLAEELAKALHALPDQFEVRAGAEQGEAMRLPCSAATPEQLGAVLSRCTGENVPLWIGWRVPRSVALEHAAILDEQLEDAALALFPVYRLIAWSRDNDHLGIDRKIQGLHEERERAHAEVVALDQKWKAEQAAERERALQAARARAEEAGPGPGRRPMTLANLFKTAPAKDGPKEGAKEREAGGLRPVQGAPPPATPPASPARASGGRDGGPRASDGPGRPGASARGGGASRPRSSQHEGGSQKPSFATRPSPDAAAARRDPSGEPTWEKGARVGINSGPFAGKVGTIAEMEGTRAARVLLGLLSARLDLSHLTLLDVGAAKAAAEGAPRAVGSQDDAASLARKAP